MTQYIEAAAAAGYKTLTDPLTAADPDAARMLVDDDNAAGVALAGGVLLVALAQVPTPARYAELEAATGMAIAVTITTTEILRRLRETAAARPAGHATQVLAGILTEGTRAAATDILLITGARPALKVAGELRTLETYPHLSAHEMGEARTWFLGEGPARGVVQVGTARWRVRVSTSNGLPVIALRQLPGAPVRAEDINAPVALVAASAAPHGLVVVASGPAGGKTTTAAALIDRINTTRQLHIVSVGSPVEYAHTARKSIITAQAVGLDCADGEAAVARAELLGADVIALDVRTVSDARAALRAALAGHLVVATVAAVSVSNALRHTVTLFDPAERDWAQQAIAATLRVATAQQLLPDTAGTTSAVFEVLSATDSVRALVAHGHLDHLHAAMEDAVGEAMSTMERSLALHVSAGRIHAGPARLAAPNPHLFDQHLTRTSPAAAPRLPAAGSRPAVELAPAPARRGSSRDATRGAVEVPAATESSAPPQRQALRAAGPAATPDPSAPPAPTRATLRAPQA